MTGGTIPRPARLGLTGGIGSGKSTVAAWLQQRGAHLVDTDALSRQLTQAGGGAIEALRRAFGDHAIGPDGALDRQAMRELVFHDPEAKRRLEALLHPLIGVEAARQAAQAQPGQMVVFDVPLLVESRAWRTRVDQVLVVDCSPARQIARVMQRSGLDARAVEAIIATQAPRARRLAAADVVIANDHDALGPLHDRLETLWALWHPA
jgi:dephospho-CoA kinase